MQNKKIMEAIKYWSQVLLIPIYWLSFLIPRNKKVWVLGSTFGRRFADNPKYFFLYLNQVKLNEIKPVWLSKNKIIIEFLKKNGLETYHIHSIQGIWFALRAKVYIYDNYTKDISFWLSGGAVKINMWHGIPLKKINMDNKFDFVRNPRTKWEKIKYALRRMSDEKPSHYVLTTSKFLVPIFSSAFATNKVLCCGYPRNDILTTGTIKNLFTQREKDTLDRILNRKERLKNAKVIIYMPTFRDSEAEFFNLLNIGTFIESLTKNNTILCIKPHPKSNVKTRYLELESDNIIVIDAELDPYSYFNYTDALITDYSSIYFDYLLLDKPIIFFYYDLEKYLSFSREMYFDYKQFTPGVKVKSFDELEKVLSHFDNLIDDVDIRNKRKEIKENVFINDNKNASEKLYQYISNYIL